MDQSTQPLHQRLFMRRRLNPWLSLHQKCNFPQKRVFRKNAKTCFPVKTAKTHFSLKSQNALSCQNCKNSFSHKNVVFCLNRKNLFSTKTTKCVFLPKLEKIIFPQKCVFPPKPQKTFSYFDQLGLNLKIIHYKDVGLIKMLGWWVNH